MKTYITLSFILTAFIFYLFYFSNKTITITKENIDVFINVLLPNLFPYILLVYLFINLKCHLILAYIIQFISIPLFKLDGKSLSIILIGILGGYPLVALLAKEIINKDNEDNLNKLVPLFSFPSLAFLTNIIYKNCNYNLFILFLISSFICLLLINFNNEPKYLTFKMIKDEIKNNKININLLTNTFNKGLNSLMIIFSNLIFFSLFNLLFSFENENINYFISGLFEFSKSSIYYSNNINDYNLFVLTFILLFGGISVNMQIIQIYNDSLLNIKKYYKYRILLIVLVFLLIYIY